MLFLAHQQGHTVSVQDGGGGATHYFGGTFMLMGTGMSILLAVLTWMS